MSSTQSIEQRYSHIVSTIESRDRSQQPWSLSDIKRVLSEIDDLHARLLGDPNVASNVRRGVYELMYRFRIAEEVIWEDGRRIFADYSRTHARNPVDVGRQPKWAVPFLERIAALEVGSTNYLERYRSAQALREELAEIRPVVRDRGWGRDLDLLDGISRRARILQERIMAGSQSRLSGRISRPWFRVYLGGAPGLGKR